MASGDFTANGKKYTADSGLTDADKAALIEVREDNCKAVANAINEALVRGMEKIGLVAEGYAKKLCPVDTGRLRNSITHYLDESDKSVYIGTNVEYGKYVELGTSHPKREAKEFLRPAAEDHGSQYRQILKSELQNG